MKYSFTKSMLVFAGCLFIASAAALASAQNKIGSGVSGGVGEQKSKPTIPGKTTPPPGKPSPGVDGAASPQLPKPAAPATGTHSCSVGSVAVFQSRVHVYCTNAAGAVRFFAAATKDPAASMFIQVAAQAKAASQKISIEYSTKTADNPSGCQTNDCRKILVLSW